MIIILTLTMIIMMVIVAKWVNKYTIIISIAMVLIIIISVKKIIMANDKI